MHIFSTKREANITNSYILFRISFFINQYHYKQYDEKIIITLFFPFLSFSQGLDFNKAYSISAVTFTLDAGEFYDDLFETVPSGEIWYVDFTSNGSPGEVSIESTDQNGNFTIHSIEYVGDGYFNIAFGRIIFAE